MHIMKFVAAFWILLYLEIDYFAYIIGLATLIITFNYQLLQQEKVSRI